MGVLYVAVNHDKKALFCLGKLLYFTKCDPETFEDTDVRPETEEEMIAYVWSEIDPAHNYTKDFTHDDAVRMGKDLFAFGIQEVICTDDMYDDEEKYGEYIYTHSLWENDKEIGRRADQYWEKYEAEDPELSGPPPVGRIGVLEGMAIHFSNPERLPSLIRQQFMAAGDVHITCSHPLLSGAEPRKLDYGWQLDNTITLRIPSQKYVKNRTYVSKRRRKIRQQRMQFTFEERKDTSVLDWLQNWHSAVVGDLQSQVQANAETLDKQSEEIAKLLQG